MLCAAGLLVLVMLTVFVRLGTTHVLVKRVHMDNFITRTVLYGNENLQTAKQDAVKIEWEKVYPFADNENVEKREWMVSQKIEKKAENVEKKIGDWTGKYLLGYYKLAEIGRGYEKGIGWNLINPLQEIVPLENGVWSMVYKRANVIEEKAVAVEALARTVEDEGAKFLYIQAPFKIDKYGDFAVNGRLDFSNQTYDELLSYLQERNISTLDLRECLHQWTKEDGCGYHSFFFRTDHHWKPETALRAAKVVGGRLAVYGIPVDDSYYDLRKFNVEVLPDFFLGSEGKRATLAKAKADDFPILHPRFTTSLHFVMPELAIDKTGPLEVTYDKKEVAHRDYYNRNPYGMYGYGDRSLITIENMRMPETDKKVLIIKDSFSDTMGPLLSLGIRNLIMLDVRVFTGSIKAYIKEQKPDVVILMYTVQGENVAKPINWSTHRDEFDFR